MKRRRLERSGSACNISSCLIVNLYRDGYAEADVNAGQHPCSARRKRRRLASAKELVDEHIRFADVNSTLLEDFMREKSADGFRRPAGGRFDDVSVPSVYLSTDEFMPMCALTGCCSAFSGPLIVVIELGIKDARASGDTALSSPCWDLLATMRRVVNYHSSWARQRHVELLMRLLLSVLGFDPMSLWGFVVFLVLLFSGNPGFTAVRVFSPAGGAPGGGQKRKFYPIFDSFRMCFGVFTLFRARGLTTSFAIADSPLQRLKYSSSCFIFNSFVNSNLLFHLQQLLQQ
ncbi:hypothetical protein F511_33498 [Dorcoceras hygrometricum]|uniref:Uncharacterized protein n=1 Tax=Dorcoceras hygrometricum TaxID=472368 RepID=A0A2Z7BWR0_9LAMI|nr:hypothetical protein F511_33498 [Dorcoceras hygrometricum]